MPADVTWSETVERPNQKKEGGLRVRGMFARNSEQRKPLISVITVVRNGENQIERTIQSVLTQTYQDIEYIIVDGGSSDRTLDIIRKYEDRLAYWISEPDKGIYEAMNKGSRLARGSYALYLNADDYLYHHDSIEQMVRLGLSDDEQPFLIVGRIIYAIRDRLFSDWISPSSERHINKYGPPHQATLIASSIYKKILYNEIFAICGDYAFWADLRQRNLFQIRYVDTIVSVFTLGGVSNQGRRELLKGVEKEIARYVRERKFSMARLTTYCIRALIKSFLSWIMGESLYYRCVLYNAYRLRRYFV